LTLPFRIFEDLPIMGDAPYCVSVNPATGEELERFGLDDAAAQDHLLDAARSGYLGWRHTSIAERMMALSRLADLLRARRDPLARTITLEMGKPITQARGEVEKCAALCDWYAANAAGLLADEPIDVGGDGRARIAYLPIGTIFAVMPWNFPLWQVLRAAIPIMAAGNGFLLKHADNVQRSARHLADAFRDAGFPQGAFGVITVGRDDIVRIIADPRIAAVTATAGTGAGAAIAAEAGRNLKKSLLELGGSDPFIILADADLDRAIPAAIRARFQNSGQVCIAAKRFIVERPVHDAFVQRFTAAVASMRLGDPLREDTEIGPMARPRLRAELHDQVRATIEEGATLLMGGKLPGGPGAFYPPTILGDVGAGMTSFREETFGPVASIIGAQDAAHAVCLANDSEYGLSSALWTADNARAEQMARSLETGGVFVNGVSTSDPRVPIGGVKKSGYGRELSHFGLKEFTNAQLLWESS
jgi:succinate-semialdehyde dehydrogenase